MRYARLSMVLLGLGLGAAGSQALAQQTTIGSPYGTVGDNFFENIGSSWGMRGNGWSFSFGGGGFTNPQFGRPQQGAGINGGFALLGGSADAFFNFTAGQGNQRSYNSQTPMVTMPNGGTAYFADTSVSPFVVGVVPVVGRASPMMVIGQDSMLPPTMAAWSNPSIPSRENHRVAAMKELMAQRRPHSGNQESPAAVAGELNAGLAAAKAMEPKRAQASPVSVTDDSPGAGMAASGDSSAGVAVPSVAEAKRLRAAEQKLDDPETKSLFARAQAAEEDNKPKLARVYYEMVARRATGELKQQALTRLQQLRTASENVAAE